MSYCTFEPIEIRGKLHANCTKCARPYPTEDKDPSRHVRRCPAAGWNPSPLAKLPCANRGEKVGGFRGKGCGGKPLTLPIYGCSVYGTCTEKPTPDGAETFTELAQGHRACAGCAEFRA